MRLTFMISKAIEKMAAMSTVTEFPLLELPNELIIRVIEFIDEMTTLSRLACTSQRLQELAEPLLYRQILLRGTTQAKQLATAFDHRPQRPRAVHALDVPANPSMVKQWSLVGTLMNRMTGLRSVMIESPLVNSTNFESDNVWASMAHELFSPFQAAVDLGAPSLKPLQNLTNCKRCNSTHDIFMPGAYYHCVGVVDNNDSDSTSQRTTVSILGSGQHEPMYFPASNITEASRLMHESWY